MQKIVAILLFAFILIPVSGQYRYHHPGIFYYPAINPGENSDETGIPAESPWLRYSIETGMMFSSLSGYNSVLSFVSPKVFIPAGSKFVFEVGGTFVSSSFSGGADGFTGRSNDFIGYARGIFSLNERTTVYGEVAKSIYSTNPFGSTNPSALKGFESYTLGMEYFITPNFRIGASVTSVNGPDPRYLYSPFWLR